MKKTKKQIYDYCMQRVNIIMDLNIAFHNWQDRSSKINPRITFDKFMTLWEKMDVDMFPWVDNGWQEYCDSGWVERTKKKELFEDILVGFLEDTDIIYEDNEIPNHKGK